ncbi:MAG: conjugal transfer protein [Pisciglobus halotolerans]|nr:conjugal transfer protein [Pisciglobus halotolerans]
MATKNKKSKKVDLLEYTYEPKKINNGKQTITDMSNIQAVYQNFLVTKTGYLVAIIETSGINLELLNEEEQTDVFDTYNTFLMTTLGDSSKEQQQYLDMTIPVDFNDYLLSYKKRYLDELEKDQVNSERAKLIASYIDDVTQKIQAQEMSTKKHLLVVKQPIKNKTYIHLNKASIDLNDKVTQYINRLEDAFDGYDLQAKKLHSDEIMAVLKNMMNFTGH